MKRFSALLISFCLILSMTACAGNPAPAEKDYSALMEQPLEGEITLSAYDSMMYGRIIESAARSFEEKYPGTKINIKTFSEMPEMKESGDGNTVMFANSDDSGAQKDYINRVSTELMSGGGADILAYDILPMLDYVKAGQVENLDNFIAADKSFNASDYQKEVFDAINTQGGKWFMPLGYNLDLYAYDSTLLSDSAKQKLAARKSFSLSDIIDAASEDFAANPETPMFAFPDYEDGAGDLYSLMMAENYSRFADIGAGEAHFDTGEFESMLENVSRYGEQKITAARRNWDMDFEDIMEQFEREASNRYVYKNKVPVMLLSELRNKISTDGANIMMSFGGMGGITDDDEVFGVLADHKGEVTTESTFGFMINSNSQNKRLAWEFIKYLLSEDVQSSPMIAMMSLPLNNAARENYFKQFIGGSMFRGGGRRAQSGERPAERESVTVAPAETADGAAVEINDGIFSEAAEMPDGSDDDREDERGPRGSMFEIGGATEQVELTDEEQALLTDFMAMIDLYSKEITSFRVRDTLADNIISEAVAQYFDGTKSAAETASDLQSKLSLYLSE